MVGKARQHKLEATVLHPGSRSQERRMLMLSVPSAFETAQDPSPWEGHPEMLPQWMAPPTSIYLPNIASSSPQYTPAILDLIKVTIEANHHKYLLLYGSKPGFAQASQELYL